MTARNKSDLPPTPAADQQAEASVTAASKQPALTIQRFSSHRDRMKFAIKNLVTERDELSSRRDHLRRQTEVLERNFARHLGDIDAALKLYESGLNSLAVSLD